MNRGLFRGVVVAVGLLAGGCAPQQVGQPPLAGIGYNPWRGEVPFLVTFVSQSRAGDGQIVSYRWDFGDGAVREGGATVTHWYTREGTFHPTLTVTDDKGLSATARGVIEAGVSYPLDVVEWRAEETYFGQRVVGTVKNIGDRKINQGRVAVRFYDKDWNLIRERSQILTDLRPGAEQIFEITTELRPVEIGGAPNRTIYTEVIHANDPLSR
jgi:hypothetical protein